MKKHPNIRVRISKTCDQLFILFTGKGGTLMFHPLQFLEECKLLDRNIIIVRDPSIMYYMNGIGEDIGSLAELIDWLRGFVAESPWIKKVYCIGTSMGGVAAVTCGHVLGAEKVWGLSLVIPALPLFCRGMEQKKFPRFLSPKKLLDSPNGKTVYSLYFHSGSPDERSARKLEGCPQVELHPLAGEGHNIMLTIIDEGKLEGLLPPRTEAPEELGA